MKSQYSNHKTSIVNGLRRAGVGTLVLCIAKEIPTTDPLKSVLEWFAPAVASGVSDPVLRWLSGAYLDFLAERKLNEAFKKAKEMEQALLHDAEVSPEHRERMRHEMEEAEFTQLKRYTIPIKHAGAKVSDDADPE
jgi:hypothetical protein